VKGLARAPAALTVTHAYGVALLLIYLVTVVAVIVGNLGRPRRTA
jgi:hypothetical protein